MPAPRPPRVTLTGISAIRLRAWAHLPHSPGITAALRTHAGLLIGSRQTKMRAFALGMIFSAAATLCFAQTVLKSEPLILAPYEVAFVQDAFCPAPKALKVTGAIRGLNHRKVCVSRGRLCNGCQVTKPPGLTDCTWRCEARRISNVSG